MPSALITSPATAGPAILARLKTALLRAMALAIPPRPTISATNVCLVGLSTTVIRPSAKARMYTCQICTLPVSASTPSSSARPPIRAWVTISSMRLEYRSAKAPPQRLNRSSGRNCRPVVIPSAAPLLCVSSSTSQSWATRCIQVPVLEMT